MTETMLTNSLNLPDTLDIPDELSGERIDNALNQMIPEYSRSKIQQWIKSGEVTLNDQPCQCKVKVFIGDTIKLDVEETIVDSEQVAQEMELDIRYEDEDLLVLNKPAGLVVHPAAGHPDGTLLNGLLHYSEQLHGVPRAGIIHRLDKDTTGLLVVAKTIAAQTFLVRVLQQRLIKRHYYALVQGEVIVGGEVDAPIGRHPRDRKRMAIVGSGKRARTHYKVAQRMNGFTLLKLQLDTGRTHQIRVHMQHIGYPIVGDQNYGQRARIPAGLTPEQRDLVLGFKRQALHATHLQIPPVDSDAEAVDIAMDMPADMQALVDGLSL